MEGNKLLEAWFQDSLAGSAWKNGPEGSKELFQKAVITEEKMHVRWIMQEAPYEKSSMTQIYQITVLPSTGKLKKVASMCHKIMVYIS